MPTATWTPQVSRPTPVSLRVIGRIEAINGNIWTIGGQQVEVAPWAEISGNAVVGAFAEAEVWERPGALPLAIRITITAAQEATPEPVEFQGYVDAINRPSWTIGGTQVKEVAGAQVSDGIAVGDRVSVKGTKQPNGEIWATSITLVPATEVQIDGNIDAIAATSITVDGRFIGTNSATQFVGTPVVGRQAQVRALQFSDGSLLALVVFVVEPPTNTPTTEPTATPTAEPTAIPLESPTATTTPTATS